MDDGIVERGQRHACRIREECDICSSLLEITEDCLMLLPADAGIGYECSVCGCAQPVRSRLSENTVRYVRARPVKSLQERMVCALESAAEELATMQYEMGRAASALDSLADATGRMATILGEGLTELAESQAKSLPKTL